MDRQSVQTLLKMPERNRFLRGLIPWTGLSAIPFDYEREMRHAGETKYTLRKMLLLSANAIATLSIAPIRLIQFFGLFLCLVALVSFPIAMVIDLYVDVDIIIYVVCLQILLSGGLMGTIGILGGYLHRIQDEVRSRPLYVVDSIWRNGRINE
jgi:dolichol-phosphate mannosyltransferase